MPFEDFGLKRNWLHRKINNISLVDKDDEGRHRAFDRLFHRTCTIVQALWLFTAMFRVSLTQGRG